MGATWPFSAMQPNLVPGVTIPGRIYVRDRWPELPFGASTNAGSLSGMSSAISYNHDDQRLTANSSPFKRCTNPLLSVSARRDFQIQPNTGSTDLVNTNAYSQAENPGKSATWDMTRRPIHCFRRRKQHH